MKPIKNLPASIRQRLLDCARNQKRPFNEIVQYYAMERFLYRLSQSNHANCFILKGALMLQVWNSPVSRPTMDIDLLGKTRNKEEDIVVQLKEIIALPVEPDGLLFNSHSIQTEQITEDADYEGIRVRFRGQLDSVKINLQIDIGFGDVVYPGPEQSTLPTVLDFPAPKLLSYTRESAIAEKFEAMVSHGFLNSRMKDFYDIWLLCRQFDFDGEKLTEAIRLTFEQRKRNIPEKVQSFEKSFIDAKQVQWTAFCKRLQQHHVPLSFQDIISTIEAFLAPIAFALSKGETKPKKWTSSQGWS